jgi:hypothetical protein
MTQTHDLVYPMLAMFGWTFLVALRNLQVRIGAISRRELTNEYFEVFRGAEPSDAVLKVSNHLKNLSEFPPLFYVAALAVMLVDRTDSLFVTLAWAYVALRVAHGLVHLSFNKVPVRFVCFALSNLVLFAIWIRLGLVL